MRSCLNCHGSMEGRTKRAKFCGRPCQVEHLRRMGPTGPAANPTAVPKALTLRLDDTDRQRLSALAERMNIGSRKLAHLILTDRLGTLTTLAEAEPRPS